MYLSDFADDIAAVLDHLGIEQAVIGGVSMGGQITMEFQRQYAQRVRALILTDTSAPAETEDGKAFRNRLADRLLAEGMDGYARDAIDKVLAAYNVTALPEVAEQVLGMMRSTDPCGAAAALRGRAEWPDYRPVLTGVDAPVLIVVGADDVYTPLSEAQEIQRHVPHAELRVIGKAGHLRGARPDLGRLSVWYQDVSGQWPDTVVPFTSPTRQLGSDLTGSGAVDAHWAAGKVYEFYRDTFHRNSLDGQGMAINSLVGVTDFGSPFVNAFWDHTKVVYGTGDDEYRSLASDLDVVGHEMTHGVVEHTANLVYSGQSGAMNEAIADYFGNVIDVTVNHTLGRLPHHAPWSGAAPHPVLGASERGVSRSPAPAACHLIDAIRLSPGTRAASV